MDKEKHTNKATANKAKDITDGDSNEPIFHISVIMFTGVDYDEADNDPKGITDDGGQDDILDVEQWRFHDFDEVLFCW